MRRLLILVVIAGAAVSTLLARPLDDHAHRVSDEFWSQTLLRANGGEFASLEELVEQADWVVEGHVVGVAPGRVLREGDVPFAWFANVTFETTRTLSGSEKPSFVLEVLFTSERRLGSFLTAALPTEAAIAAIVVKADDPDPGTGVPYLRLANQAQSLYRNIDGVVHLTIPEDAGFARAWAGIPFETFAASIAAIER